MNSSDASDVVRNQPSFRQVWSWVWEQRRIAVGCLVQLTGYGLQVGSDEGREIIAARRRCRAGVGGPQAIERRARVRHRKGRRGTANRDTPEILKQISRSEEHTSELQSLV